MDDEQFLELLDRFGLSWRGYRRVRKGVRKRIRGHMQELGCRNTIGYLQALDRDHKVRSQFERLVSVSISRFFRDRGLWDTLENEILPGLVPKHREGVKVWVAGCACGEEVYSFMIIWDRLRERLETLPYLEVLATDMNPIYLEKAQLGLFSRSSLKEIPVLWRSQYFESKKGGRLFGVVFPLKKGISWEVHDLLSDPPGEDFHLIFLRNNLLTYYREEVKTPAFRKVSNCLAPGGFLVIGSHEKLPSGIAYLSPFKGCPYIFQRSKL